MNLTSINLFTMLEGGGDTVPAAQVFELLGVDIQPLLFHRLG